jgi:hypothetical protein
MEVIGVGDHTELLTDLKAWQAQMAVRRALTPLQGVVSKSDNE